MTQTIPKIPDIPQEERTPLVVLLLEITHLQNEQIQALKDEIARLKGNNPKPDIKPSTLEKETSEGDKDKEHRKRPGSEKRPKTKDLEIHKVIEIQPDNIPEGSVSKGFQEYTVQDIVLTTQNTKYRLERFKTPDGTYLVGELPGGVNGHFGSNLVTFILYQYYHCHVTQPLLWEQLGEIGVDISTGQLSRILTENKEVFHAEKDEILRVGLKVSSYVNTDDTKARHKGKNGFATHIGNEMFAWFASTSSKSRINFLELLRAGEEDYVLLAEALEYMEAHKLPKDPLDALSGHQGLRLEDKNHWERLLSELGISDERHVRIATEGALLGSVLSHGIRPDMVIMSDDAGQFNVLLHGLCWIHADRLIGKLVGFNDEQRKAIEHVRHQLWDLYQILKLYKESPSEEKAEEISSRFDEIFEQETCFASLNSLLKRLRRNKSELLLVLLHPDMPLHNNGSEEAIRDYVKKRKISGSTRSDLGRRCRDTFASLKKTCRKLGVSFWRYLQDRVTGSNKIEQLSELVRQRAQETTM